jgi:succinoglycan biosynthesis protein ExoM
LLRVCLESIAAQQGDLPEIEVFVADNDPKGRAGCAVVEDLKASFRFPISATTVEPPGISAVRNAILDEARRRNVDFIAMIDDDETASVEWLDQLLRAQKSTGAGVVGGPVTQLFPESVPGWFRIAFERPFKPNGPIELVDATGNILMSCAALKASGWPQFDPAYGLSGGGDTEFFLRARQLGIGFGWTNEAVAAETVEVERLNIGWVLRRSYRHGIIRTRLKSRYHFEGTPGAAWIATHLAATPLYLALTIFPKLRVKALKRVAYCIGLVAGSFGKKYHEYASRH